MSLLEIKNINTGYGKKQVLHDVSFEIEEEEIVLLIGSNGSGKSTILKAIYGLLPLWKSLEVETLDQKGHIFFSGEDITGLPAWALLKKGLLYVPQKDNLFSDLTIKENLEMAGLSIKDTKILRRRIDAALDNFPSLVQHLNRTPMKLSGGERQLLALAMASLHKPKMIMVDEPFAGLSPQSIGLVQDTLVGICARDGITLLVVEHNIREASKIADKIISLKLGRIYGTKLVNTDLDFQSLHEVFV